MPSKLTIEATRFGSKQTEPFDKISRRLQRILLNRGLKDMLGVLIDSGLTMRNEMILGMRNSPPDTSKRTRVRKTGTRAQRFHNPSFAGNPPRPVSGGRGGLMGSLLVEENKPQLEVRVGSIITDPPYPAFLEEGTDRMAARPWAGPVYASHKIRIKNEVLASLRKTAREFARGR